MIKEGSVALQGGEEKKSNITRTPNPLTEEKVFGKKWIQCSGIIGLSVRERLDLVFEVERILHLRRRKFT
jgi:hypothetical protein